RWSTRRIRRARSGRAGAFSRTLVVRGSRGAALRRGHRMERARYGRPAQGRRYGARDGHRRRVDIRTTVRPHDGGAVIATSSSDTKLARLRELGAAEVINYK